MPHITGSSVLGLEIEANQWQQDRLNRFRADPGENARRAELRKAQRAADALLAASTSASEPSRNDSPSIMPSPSSPANPAPDPTQIGLDAPTRTPPRNPLRRIPSNGTPSRSPSHTPKPRSLGKENKRKIGAEVSRTPSPEVGRLTSTKPKSPPPVSCQESSSDVCDKPAVVTTVASYGTRNILFKIMIRNAAPASRAIPTLMDHLERIGTLDPGSGVRCTFSSVSLDPPVLFLPGHAIRVPASDDFILAAPIGWEVPLSESSSSPLQKGSDSPLVNLLVESGDGVHYRGVCAVKSLLNAQKYILDESILQGVKSSSSSQKLQGEAQERVIVQFYGLQFVEFDEDTYQRLQRAFFE